MDPRADSTQTQRQKKMERCRFSSGYSGGKAANAALPPFQTAEKLQVQVFLLSEWRKTGRCSFTAPCSGGKAAAWFPSVPLPSSVSFLSFFFTYVDVGRTRTLCIVFSRAMHASSWRDPANGSSEWATHGGCR